MARLTKRLVEALLLPETGKDAFLWCSEIRGFGVRAKSGGSKTFVVGYRNKRGRFRRFKIGGFPILTVDEAREQAKQLLARVAAGEDPADVRSQERNAMTVAEMCDVYMRDSKVGLVLYKNARLKPSTISRNQSRIDRHIKPNLGNVALADVTKRDVARLHEDIFVGRTKSHLKTSKGRPLVTGGRGVARKVVFLMSSIYKHANKKGFLDFNPCEGVEVSADEPCLSLEYTTQPAKSIMASRSFGRPVTSREELEEAVASFVSRAAEKLRRQHLAAGTVMVFAHTNPFKPTERQYSASDVVRLGVASSDTAKLIHAGVQGVRKIYRAGFRYKKAGIMLDALEPAWMVQGDLWTAPDDAKTKALMKTLDGLNRSWGRGTVHHAACGIRRGWAMRAEHLSPRWTTRWEDLLKVS